MSARKKPRARGSDKIRSRGTFNRICSAVIEKTGKCPAGKIANCLYAHVLSEFKPKRCHRDSRCPRRNKDCVYLHSGEDIANFMARIGMIDTYNWMIEAENLGMGARRRAEKENLRLREEKGLKIFGREERLRRAEANRHRKYANTMKQSDELSTLLSQLKIQLYALREEYDSVDDVDDLADMMNEIKIGEESEEYSDCDEYSSDSDGPVVMVTLNEQSFIENIRRLNCRIAAVRHEIDELRFKLGYDTGMMIEPRSTFNSNSMNIEH